MSQTTIPLQFERYLQNQISLGNAPDMNEMIFAYLPDLDLGLPIDRATGLPDVNTWVYQQDIDQQGKLGDNAIAYSVVIPASVEEFTFNAIYLRDKNVNNSCGVIVHKLDETKENGMSSTKSLVQEYDGAAQIADIVIDAQTWQIDYHARLKGIEEDHRLACLDTYGHTMFIDGFEVTQQADPNKYIITSGLVYLGGLRAQSAVETVQTIISKPNKIFIDVNRVGTALSKWVNQLTIVISEIELADYIDEQGTPHFVAKVATINADGSVTDERIKKQEAPSTIYISENKIAVTTNNKLHIFTAHADLKIPNDAGTAFRFAVDDSVDLDAGKCRLLAPEGQKITLKKVPKDIVNILTSGVIFTAVKVNGVWKV